MPPSALAALDRALSLQPDAPMILYSRGVVMTQLQRPQEALANYDRALALQPNLTLARGNRAMAALNICDWNRAAAIGPELAQMVAAGIPFAPLTLLGYSDDKQLQLQCARVTSHAVMPRPPTRCGTANVMTMTASGWRMFRRISANMRWRFNWRN